MSKVIDSIRFGPVGIVKIKPDHGPMKYYVGLGAGLNRLQDQEKIKTYGMPFRLPEGFISESEEKTGNKSI